MRLFFRVAPDWHPRAAPLALPLAARPPPTRPALLALGPREDAAPTLVLLLRPGAGDVDAHRQCWIVSAAADAVRTLWPPPPARPALPPPPGRDSYRDAAFLYYRHLMEAAYQVRLVRHVRVPWAHLRQLADGVSALFLLHWEAVVRFFILAVWRHLPRPKQEFWLRLERMLYVALHPLPLDDAACTLPPHEWFAAMAFDPVLQWREQPRPPTRWALPGLTLTALERHVYVDSLAHYRGRRALLRTAARREDWIPDELAEEAAAVTDGVRQALMTHRQLTPALSLAQWRARVLEAGGRVPDDEALLKPRARDMAAAAARQDGDLAVCAAAVGGDLEDLVAHMPPCMRGAVAAGREHHRLVNDDRWRMAGWLVAVGVRDDAAATELLLDVPATDPRARDTREAFKYQRRRVERGQEAQGVTCASLRNPANGLAPDAAARCAFASNEACAAAAGFPAGPVFRTPAGYLELAVRHHRRAAPKI